MHSPSVSTDRRLLLFWRATLVLLVAVGWLLSSPVQAAGKRSAKNGPTARVPVLKSSLTTLRAPSFTSRQRVRAVRAAYSPPRPTIGQAIGLHALDDPLDLSASVALIVDQQSGEILYEKNPTAVLPIASITKLMTAMVTLDARLPLADPIEISEADIDTERQSRSRLRPGTRLSRGEMLNLALMASENRAAHALGRHYPGGMPAFVAAMNDKARALGMISTRFVDPTGLSSSNVSNARDLARLVRFAYGYPLIRQYSIAQELTVDTGYRMVSFRNTNRLIDDADWNIGLSKTGFLNEAGSCLTMQASIDGRAVVMVVLDAIGRDSRFADMVRLRNWLAGEHRNEMRAAPQPLPETPDTTLRPRPLVLGG